MEQKLIKKKRTLIAKGNKLQLAEACNELAEFYMRTGNYELSRKEFESEASIYKDLQKHLLFARANRMIGEVCTTLAEFSDALKHEKIHLDIARKLQNELEEQRALASIGRTYLIKAGDDLENVDSESLQLALTYFQESLKVCENLKNIKSSELFDMKARLYLNIGIVNEHRGYFEEGENYIKKSIQICKDNDIYDQLQLAHYTLGQLYAKINKYPEAISSFKLSLEVASRLTDKVIPLCSTYIAKADTLIKMKEFTSAKTLLIKAYKLKTPNVTDHSTIEHNLKIVAAMCQAEDSLLLTPANDHKKRKNLYENIADGAAGLKAFQVAIDYYLLMLESALANGEEGKDLIPVYISLAQTYKDNKQYQTAYHYFQKDYKITKDNPEESYKTLINIAVIMELMKSPFNDVVKVYKNAIDVAKSTNSVNAEGKVLSHFVQYLKKMDKPFEQYETKLFELGYDSSDSEEDGSDTPDIGSNIKIEDLLDEEDESDDENLLREKRRRGRQMRITKNNKGETQLHLACKSGNATLVSCLISQHHPINIRDHSGWLPIHEACNFGKIEIVEILIENGAAINDRGGPDCEGITPLHDACVNGHLEVVELLLNKGASAIAQTDKSYSPLDYLVEYKNGNKIPAEKLPLFDYLIERIKKSLQLAGKSIEPKKIEIEGGALLFDRRGKKSEKTQKPQTPRRNSSPQKSPRTSQKSPIGSLRHLIDLDDDLEQSPRSKFRRYSSTDEDHVKKVNSLKRNFSGDKNSACTEYKRVMECLRKRNSEPVPKNTKKPSALLTESDVEDDWLEDDLAASGSKKRKRVSGGGSKHLIETTGTRKSNSFHSDNEQENGYESSDSGSNKRKNQSSLIDSGFVRTTSPLNVFNSTPVTLVDKINSKPYKRQQKLNSFIEQTPEYNFNTSQMNESFQNTPRPSLRPILAINVRIENKLWRIPVPANELNDLTIEWLANEAAKRYYKQEGISPTLQLLTAEGAILVNEDPLSMVFISETQAEEVQSNIVSWNLPPIHERYAEACSALKIEQCPNLKNCLKECQVTLNLKIPDGYLKENQIAPLFRALNRQNNLQHLDLTYAKIQNTGIQLLCAALPSLSQLRSLNLTKTCITSNGIQYISSSVEEGKFLENLTDLNLSFNKFGADTLEYLAKLSQKLKLRTLNLCGCALPPNIFDLDVNYRLVFNFEHLENFDISYNDLKTYDIIKFISFLNFSIISNLNVSFNNNITDSGVTKNIAEKFNLCSTTNLKKLNLAQTNANDTEIWELLRSLLKSPELDTLNLSYNPDLTAVSLRRLLQHRPTFSSLILLGCKNILQYFDQFTLTTDPSKTFSNSNILKSLKITMDYMKNGEEIDILIEMWRKEWGDKARIKRKLGKLVHFYVED